MSRGKRGSYPLWGKFVNCIRTGGRGTVGNGKSRYKQIARIIKGERARQPRGEGGEDTSHSGWSKFIDNGGVCIVVVVCYKQIARAVKDQMPWIIQSEGKGALYTIRSKFSDNASAGGVFVEYFGHKQIPRAVKGQTNWCS